VNPAFLRHVAAFALLAMLPIGLRAQGTEIVRGRVTGLDGKPIAGVTVTVTGLTTQDTRSPTTSEKGIFTALFPNPEGDYLISARKIGFAPYNTRLTRTGLSSVLVADFEMQQLIVQLDTLTRVAKSLKPSDGTSAIGGADFNLMNNALFSLDPTDLIALAAQTPGVLSLGDSAFSVLGSDAAGNNGTIDGAKFSGSNLPQDAVLTSKLIQTSSDPRVAGFTGGQTATILRGGTDVFALTTRINYADHHLAWTDPDYPNPIPRNITFSGGAGGPIIKKKLHYQASWNVRDNESDVYSLLDPPDAVISQYGLTRDTINAVSNTLNHLHIPLSPSGVPQNQTGHSYNGSLVIDWTPKATTTLRITENGNWGTNGGPGRAPSSYPSVGSTNKNFFDFVNARLTGYVHGFLDELTTSVNRFHFESNPFVNLPGASVRIGTIFDGGQTGLSSLNFGGGSGVSQSSSTDWDTQNEFSWIPTNGKHKVKIGQEIEYTWDRSFSAGNQYGQYSYQSLDDLAANNPASYNLTLSSFARSSKGASGALWVGDEWSASKALQFQGGLRYDAAFPGTTPDYNPVVDTLFGIKTDRIPHSQLITPRLGFSWTSAKRRGLGSSSGNQGPINLGNLPGNLPPEFLQMLLGTPRGSVLPGIGVNGSFGAYGNTINNGSIAGLVDQTGLPQTRRTLTCVGDATPIPDWNNPGPGPTSCLDGTGPATFSTNVPTVQVYDPNFRAALTWRANLSIDGIRLPAKWTLGITGFLNWGVDGQSALDLNLNRTPQFELASEGNRPVYVSPNSIVPSTGVVAPGAYRINQNFGSVNNTISDLSSNTQQIQFNLAPPHALLHNKLNLSFNYTLNRTEREQRGLSAGGFASGDAIAIGGGGFVSFSGFGGGSYTAGDPFLKQWVRGTQPTHQIITSASFRAWWFNVSTQLRFYSGSPYTPSVAGDVNGDGRSDDLAFIPNPATTSDPALAAEMTQLLANAPPGARDCLLKQLGQIAGINSCSTQWQARLDLSLNWQPPRSFGLGDRLRVTTTMVNTSGALVRLFGLQNTPLGRGSLSQTANGQLLYVTGFDPATQSYKYQVSQIFGQPTNFANARHYAPFQLQLGVEYKLGGPPTAPMALSMGLMPGKNEPPYTMRQIHDKLIRLAKDPTQAILIRKDSMALTPDQVSRITAIGAQFRARADSALEPVIEYALKKGRHIDDGQLNSRLGKATPVITRMSKAADVEARALLTPAQLKMLPVAPTPGALPGGGMRAPSGGATGGMPGAAMPDVGGGTVRTVIIRPDVE
jgi:hypothetical protein